MDCVEFKKLMLDGELEESLRQRGKVTLSAAQIAARKWLIGKPASIGYGKVCQSRRLRRGCGTRCGPR